MGETQRHMGQETSVTACNWGFLSGESALWDSDDDDLVDNGKGCTGDWGWRNKYLGLDLHLRCIFNEVRNFLPNFGNIY